FRVNGNRGESGQTFIGERRWHLSQGKWDREGRTYGGSSDRVIQFYESFFGFSAEQIAKGIHEVTCLGRVSEDGREFISYEYRVNQEFMAAFVSREKLYVDAT